MTFGAKKICYTGQALVRESLDLEALARNVGRYLPDACVEIGAILAEVEE